MPPLTSKAEPAPATAAYLRARQAYAASAQLDAAERERLLLEHLPQVHWIARRIHERLPAQVPLEDLYHAGVVGLMEALERFDPDQHVQFGAYARFRIRGAILDSLRELDWSPRSLRRQARQMEEAIARLHARLGRSPEESEIAQEMGLPLDQFQHLLGELRGLGLGSLERDTGEETPEAAGASSPVAVEDPFEQCLQGELRQLLAEAIAELGEQEQRVLSLYYYEELTMKEVGEVIGVGESRVSQIHTAALLKLRARLRQRLSTGHSAR